MNQEIERMKQLLEEAQDLEQRNVDHLIKQFDIKINYYHNKLNEFKESVISQLNQFKANTQLQTRLNYFKNNQSINEQQFLQLQNYISASYSDNKLKNEQIEKLIEKLNKVSNKIENFLVQIFKTNLLKFEIFQQIPQTVKYTKLQEDNEQDGQILADDKTLLIAYKQQIQAVSLDWTTGQSSTQLIQCGISNQESIISFDRTKNNNLEIVTSCGMIKKNIYQWKFNQLQRKPYKVKSQTGSFLHYKRSYDSQFYFTWWSKFILMHSNINNKLILKLRLPYDDPIYRFVIAQHQFFFAVQQKNTIMVYQFRKKLIQLKMRDSNRIFMQFSDDSKYFLLYKDFILMIWQLDQLILFNQDPHYQFNIRRYNILDIQFINQCKNLAIIQNCSEEQNLFKQTIRIKIVDLSTHQTLQKINFNYTMSRISTMFNKINFIIIWGVNRESIGFLYDGQVYLFKKFIINQ